MLFFFKKKESVAWQWQGGSGKINNQIFQSIFVVNCVNFSAFSTLKDTLKTQFYNINSPKIAPKNHFSPKNA
jgi:hypothetical protein